MWQQMVNLLSNLKEYRCYEVKIEESEKVDSCQESSPGHLDLAWAASAVSLSHEWQLDNPQLASFSLSSTSPYNNYIPLFPVWGKMLSAIFQ